MLATSEYKSSVCAAVYLVTCYMLDIALLLFTKGQRQILQQKFRNWIPNLTKKYNIDFVYVFRD